MAAEPHPTCPYLPETKSVMSWRDLREFGTDRGPEFYFRALQYGHYLWQQGLAARSILALDRALFADLAGNESVLKAWSLPYRAIGWMLTEHTGTSFIGNPRVHYQHLADRVKGRRAAQKKWRAWACWYLTRRLRPELEADPRHSVVEPSLAAILTGLHENGIPEEAQLFQQVLGTAT